MLATNGLGNILAHFFTNSSGHPDYVNRWLETGETGHKTKAGFKCSDPARKYETFNVGMKLRTWVETSYLGMKLPTWVWNFLPGYETSYLGMKLPTWVWNVVRGYATSYVGMQLPTWVRTSYLGMKLPTWVWTFYQCPHKGLFTWSDMSYDTMHKKNQSYFFVCRVVWHEVYYAHFSLISVGLCT
jgi:hypothetical protein